MAGGGLLTADRLRTALLLALGGGLGAEARYVAGGLAARAFGTRLPWGTFLVNVSGCLALGFVLTLLDEHLPDSRAWRALVAVGFLGAYTTFSTFAWEGNRLLASEGWGAALGYALGSVAAGLLAVRGGILLARMVP